MALEPNILSAETPPYPFASKRPWRVHGDADRLTRASSASAPADAPAPTVRTEETHARIAVIEPSPRAREAARQSIRRLGHVPVPFEDLAQWQAASPGARQCDLLLLSGTRDVQRNGTLLKAARAALGRTTSVVLLVPGGRVDLVPPRARVDGIASIPRTGFQAMHQTLRRIVLQQRLCAFDDDFTVGPYRFSPANGSMQADGDAVSLHPLEFDLALQFFRHADSTLSREWLRTMVWERAEVSARAIDMRVRRLRRKLKLEQADGWKLLSNWGGGYRLMSPTSSVETADKSPVRTATGSLANLEAAMRRHMQETVGRSACSGTDASEHLLAGQLLAVLRQARHFVAADPRATDFGSPAHGLLAGMDAVIDHASTALRG